MLTEKGKNILENQDLEKFNENKKMKEENMLIVLLRLTVNNLPQVLQV